MNFDKMLDETQAIDASSISSSVPWKQRIVEYVTANQGATPEQILKATDPKYDGSNYTSRKHCLDSQLTYIRQDYNIAIQNNDAKIVFLGVIKNKKLVPFKTAVPFIKK